MNIQPSSLHQAAGRWANQRHTSPRKRIAANSFIAGAKWMQERIASGNLIDPEDYIPPSAANILDIVCAYLRVPREKIIDKHRGRSSCEARQIAMYFMAKHTTLTLCEIGQLFGGRHHSTVVHARNTIEDLISYDDSLRRKVETVAGLF